MKSLVVINKSHSLFSEQVALVGEDFERLDIPEEGLTLAQIEELARKLDRLDSQQEFRLVIASPIPALFKWLARLDLEFCVLHNDRRDAKEVPDGKGGKKVIHTVSATGWRLV